MRNTFVQLCLVIMGISSIHAARLLHTSSFHVRMYPANGADRVWAIRGKDSIQMININGEYFLRSMPPGHWEVAIEANAPFRSVRFNTGEIKPGFDKDLGEIRLQRP